MFRLGLPAAFLWLLTRLDLAQSAAHPCSYPALSHCRTRCGTVTNTEVVTTCVQARRNE
jgi:hypothetical protein